MTCALVLEAACSSSPRVATHDAGRDVVTPHDAISANHNVDAAADAKHEAGATDAAHVCSQALAADVCTSDAAGSCRRTWAEVLATPPQWCYGFWRELRGTCGAYNVNEFLNVDSGEVYYYDASTGQLTAIYAFGNNPALGGCEAGPPEGITCAEATPLINVCLQDAGADTRD